MAFEKVSHYQSIAQEAYYGEYSIKNTHNSDLFANIHQSNQECWKGLSYNVIELQ